MDIHIHKVAKLFPPMDENRLRDLMEDVKKNGLLEPIKYFKNGNVAEVIDGKNRIKVLKLLKINPWSAKTVSGAPVMQKVDLPPEQDSLTNYAVSLNLHRRHLTKGEYAALAVELEPYYKEEAKESQREAGRKAGGRKADKPDASANGKASKGDADKDDDAEKPTVAGKPTAKQRGERTALGRAVKAVGGGVSDRNARNMKRLKKEAPDLYEAARKGKTEDGRAFNIAMGIRELENRLKTAEMDKAAASAPEPTPEAGEILVGDCVELMAARPQAYQLAITDPPYNYGIDYGSGKKADEKAVEDYQQFCANFMQGVFDALDATGTFFLIGPKEHGAFFHDQLVATGFHIRSWVTLYETFGQNMSGNFNKTSRFMFYCVKNPKKFTFNKDAIARASKRQELGDPRANPAGKNWDDVIIVPRLVGNAKERVPGVPTQLSLELIQPLVELASMPGDKVLDPFCGSGTTLIASTLAKGGARICTTMEEQQKTADIAKKRWLAELSRIGKPSPAAKGKKKKAS